jgi:hypothetical protein
LITNYFLRIRFTRSLQGYPTNYLYSDHYEITHRKHHVYDIEFGKELKLINWQNKKILFIPNILALYRNGTEIAFKKGAFYNSSVPLNPNGFGLGAGAELVLQTKNNFTFGVNFQIMHVFEQEILKVQFFADLIPNRNMAAFQPTIGYVF